MKKLLILLAGVCAVGAAGIYMLENHADLQVKLSTSLVTEEEPEGDGTLDVKFSINSGLLREDTELDLTCGDKDAVIYYTLDGNDPGESSKKYTSPIKLTAKKRAAATTVKAVAVKDGVSSPIAVKSYITCTDTERFDENTLIFVLSTDEYNLYDYYYGVATEGYKRDEYLNSDEYDGGEISYNAPANWFIRGRESERDMYVEVFDSEGSRLISQAAGARVVGGVSRANDQKSWRLIARNCYSESGDKGGKFKYPFFGLDNDAYGNMITRYDRITLRDGANDREFAGVREELSMTLSFEAGFPDTHSVRPAAVFLNSRYYGYAWLHEAYSADYLEAVYGGSKDNFRIVGTKELDVTSEDEADEQALEDWRHLVALAEEGLTDDSRFAEFCSLVDMDDLMLYYAIQIYIDNKDWPGNNFKAWRYYPSEGEIVNSPYLDGKWRFLLFDMEYGWGLYGNGYRDDTLKAVLTGNHMQGASHILAGLLEREDMRERFANTVCELIGGAFSPENVKEKLGYLLSISDHEQLYALENGYVSEWANIYTFSDSRDQIVKYAEKRPSVILKNMAAMFEYEGSFYDVTLHNPDGALTSIGSQTVSGSGSFSAQYFRENKVKLSVKNYDGFVFDRFEVNGKEYREEELTLSADMADEEGKLEIGVFMKKTQMRGGIVVSELYTAGDGDWVEIYNPTDAPVNIRGCHLSDNADELSKYTIPDCEIPSGETVTFVCKNNSEGSALGRHQTNFSLKTGEMLYFSDPDGNIISRVGVIEAEPDKSLTIGYDGRYHLTPVTEGKHYYG